MEENYGYFYGEALRAFEAGDTDKAYILISRLLEFDPVNINGQELMLQIQKKREKPSSELHTALEYYKNSPSERSAKKLGFTYKHLQRYNMAKDVFKTLLDERPDDHETRGALGKIYVNLEDYDDALPLLEETSIKRPGDSDVLYDLGLCYFKTKQYKKSLDIFENMRLAYGAEKGVRAWLGRCYEMAGDDKQALFYFKEELELFPWSPEGAEFLYFYYKEKGDTAAAFEVLEQAKTAVKKRPAEAMSMGVMLTRCALFERGLELFKFAESSGAERGYGLALLYSNMGVAYQGLRDFKKTEECYNKSLEIYSGCHNAVHNKGLSAYIAGRYKEAIEHIEHALSMEPDRDITLTLMAEALFGYGDIEKGIEYFEAAVKRKPKSVSILMRYASSLFSKDMEKQAEEKAKQALLIKPGFQEAYLLLARIKAYNLEPDAAREFLDKVTDPELKNTREYIYALDSLIKARKTTEKDDSIPIKTTFPGVLSLLQGVFTAAIPKEPDRKKNKLPKLAGFISGEIHKGAELKLYFAGAKEKRAFKVELEDLNFMIETGSITTSCILIVKSSIPNDPVSQDAIKNIENFYKSLK